MCDETPSPIAARNGVKFGQFTAWRTSPPVVHVLKCEQRGLSLYERVALVACVTVRWRCFHISVLEPARQVAAEAYNSQLYTQLHIATRHGRGGPITTKLHQQCTHTRAHTHAHTVLYEVSNPQSELGQPGEAIAARRQEPVGGQVPRAIARVRDNPSSTHRLASALVPASSRSGR